MGALLLASFFLDQQASDSAMWQSPKVSMVSLVIAMVWLGRLVWNIKVEASQREKVLKDRIERLERKLVIFEDDARDQRRPGRGPDIPPIDPGR